MKNHFTLLAFLATSSLIATAGCSDHSKDADPTVQAATPAAPSPAVTVAPAPPDTMPVTVATPATPDPFLEITAALEKVTLAQTASLAALQQNMERAITNRIDAWKAAGGASTNKSEERLTLARTDFAQKLGALSTADDTTWKNAKEEAVLSLQSLQRAYRELLAGPVKN
jgi:hypothetical protein